MLQLPCSISAWRLRLHRITTSIRYIVAICTLALSSTKDMASKYLSSCHIKLSNPQASLDPLKVLGFDTRTLWTSRSGRPSILTPTPATWITSPSSCPPRMPSTSIGC
ncbi:hypothetical protein AMTRI_Chr03g47590 [Amborella trichopoda]